jgi:16S rRNA G966 N2-methylase RsmD
MKTEIKIHCEGKLCDPKSLKPDPENPNRHPEDQLERYKKVIQSIGIRKPVVVSRRSGTIITGHGLAEACSRLGCKVPVVIQPFKTRKEELALMLADNRLPELSEFDAKAAEVLLRHFSSEDVEMTAFDVDDLELPDDIGKDDLKTPTKAESEALLKKWGVKSGQIWRLGEHRLMCGDALDADNWKKLGGPFRLCFADPPYELQMTITSLRSATRDHLLFMATDKILLTQPQSGFHSFFVYCFESAGSAPWTTTALRQHTLIGWWRFRDKGKVNLKGLKSVFRVDGGNQQSGVDHGQAKPVELPAEFLKFFSKKGEEVADAFAGAGSTLLACEALKRKCRSIELSPANCALILQRFQDATHVEPTHEA